MYSKIRTIPALLHCASHRRDNEIRIHVAPRRHIILVERGRSASRCLLYMEFQVGGWRGEATTLTVINRGLWSQMPAHMHSMVADWTLKTTHQHWYWVQLPSSTRWRDTNRTCPARRSTPAAGKPRHQSPLHARGLPQDVVGATGWPAIVPQQHSLEPHWLAAAGADQHTHSDQGAAGGPWC